MNGLLSLVLYAHHQMIALTWINEFVKLSGRVMLPHTSGILSATIPCLAFEDPTYASKYNINSDLCKGMKIDENALLTVFSSHVIMSNYYSSLNLSCV